MKNEADQAYSDSKNPQKINIQHVLTSKSPCICLVQNTCQLIPHAIRVLISLDDLLKLEVPLRMLPRKKKKGQLADQKDCEH